MKTTAKSRKSAAPVDWRGLARKILPHAAIVLAGMLVVFFVIDRINKPMGFMTNEFHKIITFALALLAIYMAVRLISIDRRAERMAYKRRLRDAQKTQTDTPAASGASKSSGKAAAPSAGKASGRTGQ